MLWAALGVALGLTGLAGALAAMAWWGLRWARDAEGRHRAAAERAVELQGRYLELSHRTERYSETIATLEGNVQRLEVALKTAEDQRDAATKRLAATGDVGGLSAGVGSAVDGLRKLSEAAAAPPTEDRPRR